MEKLDAASKEGGGFSIAGADDIFCVGPRGVVLPAVVEFSREVKQRCGLELQWGKTEYFCWEGDLPEGSPQGLKLAGRVVAGTFRRGFLCWGVPVGENEYVSAILEEKVEQIVEEGQRSLSLLLHNRQAAWAALKWSVWPRFEYWAGLCYPSDSLPAAKELDRQLWQLMESVCGTVIPRSSSRATREWDCTLPIDIQGRELATFASWVVRQPVKLGGMGLRSYSELCRPAFYGSMEQVVPRLHKGFCTMLEPVVGGEESFGENALADGRWRQLLDSGSRLAAEFQAGWESMQREAEQGEALLGEAVTGPLAVNAASAGEGCCSGATRGEIIQSRECLMGRLLAEGLERLPNQETRPVWSWPERDKLSSQWLLALPGPDSSLTSEEFTQCIEAHLCLPSTACAPMVGVGVGRGKVVDIHGDTVVAAQARGDGFRRRHDQIKRKIVSLHKWAGVDVECEVFNLFSGLIPQQGLARIEAGRKRQGLVPDFLVREPSAEGAGDGLLVLAEEKVITCCPTRYQRNPRAVNKAVNRRAALLPGEYTSHAKKVDREYGGVPAGVVGPVQAKLASFPPLRGWVFGAWGEASDDVHQMVDYLAEARQKHQQLLEGGRWRARRMGEEAELAMLKGQVRRTLSLEAVRSQARLLLDRLRGIGGGADDAARRRSRWAEVEERRMGRLRRAHQLALLQGRPIRARGQFFLQQD